MWRKLQILAITAGVSSCGSTKPHSRNLGSTAGTLSGATLPGKEAEPVPKDSGSVPPAVQRTADAAIGAIMRGDAAELALHMQPSVCVAPHMWINEGAMFVLQVARSWLDAEVPLAIYDYKRLQSSPTERELAEKVYPEVDVGTYLAVARIAKAQASVGLLLAPNAQGFAVRCVVLPVPIEIEKASQRSGIMARRGATTGLSMSIPEGWNETQPPIRGQAVWFGGPVGNEAEGAMMLGNLGEREPSEAGLLRAADAFAMPHYATPPERRITLFPGGWRLWLKGRGECGARTDVIAVGVRGKQRFTGWVTGCGALSGWDESLLEDMLLSIRAED